MRHQKLVTIQVSDRKRVILSGERASPALADARLLYGDEVQQEHHTPVQRFGVFEVNLSARELRKHGVRVRLSGQPFEILAMLLSKPGSVVTREELRGRLWDSNTFVDFEHSLNSAIKKLRAALGDNPENSRYIETIPRVGYRFIAPVQESVPPEPVLPTSPTHEITWRVWAISAGVLVIVGAVSIGAYKYRSHLVVSSNTRKALLVPDFTNATDDPVFDGVLRDVVVTELNRSAVLVVVDHDRMSQLLGTLGQAPDPKLTPQLAQEVCERGQGDFLVEGAITRQGVSGYALDMTASDCKRGRVVFRERADPKNINEVLTALAKISAATRARLSGNAGDTSADPAALPTSSVQALKAYTTGLGILHSQPLQSAALLRQATQVDPDFADAWSYLAIADDLLGEKQREDADLKRAFALRDKASAASRSRIEASYYRSVTGEVYKAIDALHSLENLQPNLFPPHNLLGITYAELGLYQKSEEEFRWALAVAPNLSVGYTNLAATLQAAGKYDESEAVLDRASEKKFDGVPLHLQRYQLALLRSDAAGLERESTWMAQNADDSYVISMQARIDLLSGNLSRARERTQHATEAALESNLKEFAGETLLDQSMAETLFGEPVPARKTLAAAIKLANSKAIQSRAACIMALSGQGREAQKVIDVLLRETPRDTFLNAVDAPIVLAASQLENGRADMALRSLEPVKAYEFGWRGAGSLLPNYLRAMAYLKLRRGEEAAAEFRAVLEHRGVEPMAPTWQMSQLGLARAYALQGDTTKAKTAYQDFLSLWRDADPDIPVLQQAKSEYAKLR